MTNSSRPLLVYVGAVWSFARSLLGVLSLIGWARMIQWAGDSVAHFVGPWSISMAVQAIGFFLLAIPILLGINWGRVGFLGLSALVFLWTLLRGPTEFGLYRAIYPLSSLLIASWLFHQASVLSFFDVNDMRPKWLSRNIRGVSLDLVIGISLLIIGFCIELSGVLSVLPV